MKKIQPDESDFTKWFGNNFQGWTERIEPTLGMNPGIPDRLCMTDIGLVPTELKIASLSDGRLWSREVRPSQISWHIKFAQQNRGRAAVSVFLFGVWAEAAKAWRIFALNGTECHDWENGFPIASLVEISPKKLTLGFEMFCASKV